MRKTIISLTSAAALATAGVAMPIQKAEAHPWVVPVIVVAAVGGAILGAAFASSRANAGPYAYYPDGAPVYRAGAYGANCEWKRVRVQGHVRRVQVC